MNKKKLMMNNDLFLKINNYQTAKLIDLLCNVSDKLFKIFSLLLCAQHATSYVLLDHFPHLRVFLVGFVVEVDALLERLPERMRPEIERLLGLLDAYRASGHAWHLVEQKRVQRSSIAVRAFVCERFFESRLNYRRQQSEIASQQEILIATLLM
jgi:hypothetical protein